MIKTWHDMKIPEGTRIPWRRRYNRFLHERIRKESRRMTDHLRDIRHLAARREIPIVVSLTSFPARIGYVAECIASLFRQTMPPDRIVLWLAEEQFPDRLLPDRLRTLEEYGLEIRYCDQDLKGHKKYFYAARDAEKSYLVTVDDDFLFPEDTVETLFKTHLEHPDCIVCHRAKEIRFDPKGALLPYKRWSIRSRGKNEPSFLMMATTGAGTLYPPGLLDERAYDVETIKRVCLPADDLWIKTISLMAGIKVVRTGSRHRPLTEMIIPCNTTLYAGNVRDGGNDRCLADLQRMFPQAFHRLFESRESDPKNLFPRNAKSYLVSLIR